MSSRRRGTPPHGLHYGVNLNIVRRIISNNAKHPNTNTLLATYKFAVANMALRELLRRRLKQRTGRTSGQNPSHKTEIARLVRALTRIRGIPNRYITWNGNRVRNYNRNSIRRNLLRPSYL